MAKYTHILGHNLNVNVAGARMALAKTCTMEVRLNLREAVDPTSGGWKRWVAQASEWSISCGGLYSAMGAELLAAMTRRKAVEVEFTDSAHGLAYKGAAWIENLQQTGTLRELATYTVKLRGEGALEAVANNK